MAPSLRMAVLFALSACGGEQPATETALTLSPSNVAFDCMLPGESESMVVEAGVGDGAEVEIVNISVTNIEGEHFSIGDINLPRLVSEQNPLTIDLLYAPLASGEHRAQLEVTHNGTDSPAVLDVSGCAKVFGVATEPLALQYGPVAIGQPVQKQVTLTNMDAAALVLTLTMPPDFEVVNSPDLTLDPGETMVLIVTGARRKARYTSRRGARATRRVARHGSWLPWFRPPVRTW